MDRRDNLALSAEHLGKKYALYDSAGGRLIEGLSGGRVKRHRDFWALRDFSFAVEKGEGVAIIGQNGSGKSTLLKLLAGLSQASEGKIRVNGRISSLIELGTGFNPEFSGRTNARLNATLLGLSPQDIERKFPEIEAFAAIGDFIDRPVKTYSSGMQVRLAFSVAIAVEPEILLIDEALAVGDLLFQQKCMGRLKALRARGVTLVMVTHDLAAVKNFADRVYLLDAGRMIAAGPTGQVVDEYNALIQRRALEGTDRQIISVAGDAGKKQRHGSFGAIITGLDLLDAHGESAAAFTAGSPAEIRVRVSFLDPLEDPVVGILIRDRLTNHIFGTNSHLHHLHPGVFSPGESLEASFRMNLELGPGEYSVTVAVHTDVSTFESCFDWADDLVAFKILPTEPGFIGVARLTPELAFARTGEPSGSGESAFAALFHDAPPRLLMGEEAHRRFLIHGFYAPETDADGALRWCSAGASFVLSPAGRRLEIFGLAVPPEPGAMKLTLRMGAREVATCVVTRTGWQTMTFELPVEIPPGPQRFQLAAEPPYIPSQRGDSSDERVLGIAIRRIDGGSEEAAVSTDSPAAPLVTG